MADYLGKMMNPASRNRVMTRLKQKGFSLIEAAVVLGIVGLIISGVWVAAAEMMENWKVSKTVSDIQLIVQRAQKLMSISDSMAMSPDTNGTALMRDAGVFPDDWVSGGTVKSPFWGTAYFDNRESSGRFDLGIRTSVPQSVCIKLIVRMGAMGAMAGDSGSGSYARSFLGYAFAHPNDASPGTYITTFPIDPATAKAACISAHNNWVAFGFGFTRTN